MLEYAKTILEKVAFDEFLFKKELRKAKRFLTKSEMQELTQWCNQRFGSSSYSFSGKQATRNIHAEL